MTNLTICVLFVDEELLTNEMVYTVSVYICRLISQDPQRMTTDSGDRILQDIEGLRVINQPQLKVIMIGAIIQSHIMNIMNKENMQMLG